jgi:hypothetical protein
MYSIRLNHSLRVGYYGLQVTPAAIAMCAAIDSSAQNQYCKVQNKSFDAGCVTPSEVVMKNSLLTLCLSVFLVGIPFAAGAQEAEQASCDTVKNVLSSGGSAGDAVRATMETGMSLAEATVYAMVCVGDQTPEAIATAGIEAAGNLAQAQSVANAVLASAGQTGAVADAVRAAMQEYVRHMPQPAVYQDKYSPTGGDSTVSPAE